MNMQTTSKQGKISKVAKDEFVEETRHKRTRFAAAAIGLIIIGALFVAIAVAYPYFS
tara:strand:- start:9508 stop:9678 length:171 start_codon:yes stop_codon:yes gene_type:complete